MAKKVVWDSGASDDLYDLYHAFDGLESRADAIVEAIFNAASLLENFPFLGRSVPEINLPSIRELIVQKYRIIYFISDGPEIRILAVRHSGKPLGDLNR